MGALLLAARSDAAEPWFLSAARDASPAERVAEVLVLVEEQASSVVGDAAEFQAEAAQSCVPAAEVQVLPQAVP